VSEKATLEKILCLKFKLHKPTLSLSQKELSPDESSFGTFLSRKVQKKAQKKAHKT
jgi:hypothetical protein